MSTGWQRSRHKGVRIFAHYRSRRFCNSFPGSTPQPLPGTHTGCAYGYGDLAPFTGPRDCPVCNGSGFEGHIETTLPHSDFGDPECCGCLNGVIRGDQADIVCNECGTVLRTVPAANVGQTLTELEITLEVASEMCPHCGSVNLFPGFSKMLAFTCRQCGKAVLRPE